ncbi:hypothetical protein [Cohaesibacter haloalkalitolerans]|uniref:hypothetical protein n=1 Tax=Cohaesibacter haloalkalitolerans TaxID=1162980 RepID=UPI000E658919|nr:hypothetical protein [Cohaesibacter haloalkalitolerans]
MKLTAIALPLLVAFTVCSPAIAQDNTRYPYQYLRHGQTLPAEATRPGKAAPKATQNKAAPRQGIREKTVEKKIVERKVIRQTVIQQPRGEKIRQVERRQPQVDNRQDRITRTIRKHGFYDIRNFVKRGDVASLTARNKDGILFNLKIDSRSGLILKSWRVKETRPAPRHTENGWRPGSQRPNANQWRPNNNRDYRYPRQGYYENQRSGDVRYHAYYTPYGYSHRDRTPFWSY